jgi:hypothetical protein
MSLEAFLVANSLCLAVYAKPLSTSGHIYQAESKTISAYWPRFLCR